MCLEECTYDLRSYYVTEYDLAQNDQSTFRWNGTSTNILKDRFAAKKATAKRLPLSIAQKVAGLDFRLRVPSSVNSTVPG